MSEENKLPAAVDAQDTRTRKTVKLRPAAPISQDIPISDPLASRDTDTGNLEILDDTQTRKTLKLKPMAPGGTTAPKINLAGDANTNTRKTVILRPAAPTGPSIAPAAPAPAPAAAPAPVPAAKVDVDDQTRAVPRPAMRAATTVKLEPETIKLSSPVTMKLDPAAKVEVDDQTRAVPRPAAGASGVQVAAAPEEDQTVKLQRPARPMPAPAGVQRPGSDAKATVKLPATKVMASAPAPAPAAAPKPPTAAPAPAVPKDEPAPTASVAAPEPPKAPKTDDGDISLAPSKRKVESAEEGAEKKDAKPQIRRRAGADADEANQPSLFYLILAVATLLFVAAAGVITTVHYLDFEHKINIQENVPMLPVAK